MDNMTNLIGSHIKKITNSYNETNGKTCNWRNKSNCPLDNKCLANKIGYIVYLIDCDIKWSILKKSSEYSIVSKSCNLCILEKLVICNFRQKALNIEALNSCVVTESATTAEIIWALKPVRSGYSNSLCDDIANTLKAMCPDSQIVKDFKLGCLKLMYIVNYGIASYFKQLLDAKLKKSP